MENECDLEPLRLFKNAGEKGKKPREKSSEVGMRLIQYLERYPATPKKLSDETEIDYDTVKSNLRVRLKNLGLLRQLDNGKYVAKWIGDEEVQVKAACFELEEKLRRRPRPEEIALCIKESPQRSKELILKYYPRYTEPEDEEIQSAGKALARIIAIGILELPSKKTLFKRGIEEVTVKGIDQETLNEVLTGIPEAELEEAKTYLKKFPGMRPKLTFEDKGNKRHYKVKWSYDARDYLHIYCPKDKFAWATLPRRLRADPSRYWKMIDQVDGEKRSYVMARLEEMSRIYAPTQSIINSLLNRLDVSGIKEDMLAILKMFVQNGLEVGRFSEVQKVKLSNRLAEIAFKISRASEDEYPHEYDERWRALEIIKMLNGKEKEVGEKAKEFIYAVLQKGYSTGNYLFEVAKWLAENPDMRIDLAKTAEEILINSTDKNIVIGCKEFLKRIGMA